MPLFRKQPADDSEGADVSRQLPKSYGNQTLPFFRNQPADDSEGVDVKPPLIAAAATSNQQQRGERVEVSVVREIRVCPTCGTQRVLEGPTASREVGEDPKESAREILTGERLQYVPTGMSITVQAGIY